MSQASDKINNGRGWWQRFFDALSRAPSIGGLSITPTDLHFTRLAGRQISSASLRLPPGVISQGKINQPVAFKAALTSLYRQITGHDKIKKEVINVVISLPFSRTHLQVFRLPPVAANNLNEAIKLNLEMISPLKLDSAYYDWQKIGEVNGQSEFLGALAPSAEVDLFSEALIATGFSPLVVEFSSLALARFFISAYPSVANPSIILSVNPSGLNFILIRNGILYFDYSISWSSIQGSNKTVSPADFESSLTRSLQQVLNFYSSKFGQAPKQIFIALLGGGYEAITRIASQFSLTPVPISNSNFPGVTPNWFTALGLGLRGQLPRSQDHLISLAKFGPEEIFTTHQIKSFVNFWRSIIISSLSFLLFVVLVSNIFLNRSASRLGDTTTSGTGQAQILQDVDALQAKADQFNNLITAVKMAEVERYNWSNFITRLNNLSGGDITLTRIFYQSPTVPIIVSGQADNVETILAFRDRIVAEADFLDVSLPLANVSYVGNKVSFNLSFVFTSAPNS